MNLADGLILIVVAVLLGFAVWGTVRHFKGSGCCGSSCKNGCTCCKKKD